MIKVESENIKIFYTHCIGNTNIDDVIDFSYRSDLLIFESSFIIDHNSNSKTYMTASIAGLSNCKKIIINTFFA